MISVASKKNGSDKTYDFLVAVKRKKNRIRTHLERCGMFGVQRLTYATPFDTGETAMSWSYEIIEEPGGYRLQFNNSHIENGVNIAVILQTGHPTRNGGWVEGRDYINEALAPVFDEIADKVWGEIRDI